ncbi:MAG: methionyl-tRNA formyltransferase [Campylobacteraceae bacterium]|nr:methionyl-tRNA formyltransferase [Campylobacteraceae bacterium]
MKIVFMGTPEYATSVLDALVKEGYEIPAIFTQPDRPVGRKKVLTPPDVKRYALENCLESEIYQPLALRDEEIYQTLKSINPDFIIVAAYGQILPKEILEIAPCINLHASILPKYRGASPIQSAILEGDSLSGVTAMLMDVGLDDGDMLAFSFIDIKGLKSSEVFDRMGEVAAKLTIKTLAKFKSIQSLPQAHALSTKCSKIQREDGLVKFSDDASLIMRKFRAFYPWPGVFLEDGTKLLDIKLGSNLAKFSEGEISNLNKDSFNLQFKNGEIEVLEIQEAGKKAVLAKDFINGKRLNLGDRISE